MGKYKQGGRLLELATPLAPDLLLAKSFTCTERISGLYGIQISACADEAEAASVQADSLIGQRVYVRVQSGDDAFRFFHGIVRRFTFAGSDEEFHHYNIEAVPFLWRLSQVVNCRIFQDKSIPDILEAVLGEHGVKFTNQISQPHKPWDYCVQYRESDYNFLCRIMEQEAIFFYFKQGEDYETMILGDANSANPLCPGGAPLLFRRKMSADDRRENIASNWEASQELRSGMFSMRDHNFQKPESLLHVSEPSTSTVGGADKLEIFDYPGEYAQLFNKPDARLGEIQSEGESAVKRRMRSEETEVKLYTGESQARTLIAGCKFKLEEHNRADFDGDYVLTTVHHQGVQTPSYRSGEEAPVPYRNTFRCIPFATPYVPARNTPKPVVQGPQTAVVVGPGGEEIYVDKYGRVKVQFFWDREGHFNESSSCWVRVSQLWAGKKWGSVFHPRIGQEVIVGFLEGDPDQPVVIGRLHNLSEMPPYTLPDNSTMSAIKSYSSKGGGGFNEFRFEDKKGSEHIFTHAEKDFHTRIKNEEFRLVQKNRNLKVDGDFMEKVGGDSHHDTTGDEHTKTGGSWLVKGGQDIHLKAGMNLGAEGGMTVHIKGGMTVVIEAGMQLSLKAAGSFVDINPAGVSISGPMVLINSGGAAGSGNGIKAASPKAPADPLNADPGQRSANVSQGPPVPARSYSPQAASLGAAAVTGAPFCDT